MGYDAAGNLAWSASGLASGTACHATGLVSPIQAERVARTYDLRNRVTLVDYPSGTDDVATTYHADGTVATVAMGIVTLEYDYNRRRLLTGERLIWNANTWLTNYGYTANGHAATVTYRDGHQVSFAPNALGQATQAGSYATNATYFPNGGLKQFTYGNGIVHTLTQNARQLPERSRDLFGSTAILDDTYDYDQNGNVAGISDALSGQPGNRDMTYDALDRLLTVTAGSAQGGNAVFAYDVLDNITRLDQGARTIRHQYDANNRLDSVKNAAGTTLFTLGHDIRGNQTSRTTGGVTDTYTFTRANRLTATNIGGVASTYRYDGMGRRMQHTEAGVSSYFQYGQSGQLLFSQDVVNRYNHIYLSGSLVAKRLVPFAAGPTTVKYQHTDALGSPVAETNEAGGLLLRERMTAYGEPADGTWQNGPGFTGHQMDAGAKLVYMQQRYYDPAIGRFLSVDPVAADSATGANFNRYWYANQNPIRFKDPNGLLCADAIQGGQCVDADASKAGSDSTITALADSRTDDRASAPALARRFADPLDEKAMAAISENEDGDVRVSFVRTASADTASSEGMKSEPTTIAGAVRILALIHPHPTRSVGIEPGEHDKGSVAGDRPMYIIHGKRVGVLEASSGKWHFRMVRGTLNDDEIKKVVDAISR